MLVQINRFLGTALVLSCMPVAAADKPTAPYAEPDGPPAATARRPVKDGVPLDVQARQAAERALPYIETHGTAWMRERKCLACHYVSFMVWSFHDASLRAFPIDRPKLAQWTDWSLDHAVGQGVEGPAQVLLARDRTDTTAETRTRVETLRDAIVQGQQPNGSWKPGGQLPSQKRPLTETTQVSTMWCVLALDSLDPPDDAAVAARDKALAWLKETPPNGRDPAVSSEWYAAKLLIARQFGEPQQAETLRDKILAAQHPDGGWGWRWADPSDAFGTGLSLYALSRAGVPGTHPAVQRAWRFLIETQTDDGSWIVHGTKKETMNKPHPFSGFWGTTWALLGLSHSLPDPAPSAASVSAVPEPKPR